MAGLYRSKVFRVTLTLLILTTLGVSLNVQPLKIVHASSVIIVPDDYATIQDAIGNASAGDTIYVRSGTYYGALVIDKPLTLRGENKKNPIVFLTARPLQEPYCGIGLWIVASNVTVSGFHFVSPASPFVCMIGIDGRNSVANNNVIMHNVLEEKPPYCDALTAISSQGDIIIGNTIVARENMLEEGGATITLDGSDNCLIAKNNVTAGWAGIIVMGDHNVVAFNTVADSRDFEGLQMGGITFENSCAYNTVVGNTLVGNDYGVSCWRLTHDNVIYHNNFIDNMYQGYSESVLNSWDNGYPSGGNYWSDYNGTDLFMGPYQNVTGSDGIGDTPMISGLNVVDHYPLMNPVGEVVGDVNLDGKVDIRDISVVAHSFALTAGDIRWNPLADVNGDGKIDICDISLIARNFGKSWL